MEIIFKGKIFPNNILEGMEIKKYLNEFKIFIKNNDITISYIGENRNNIEEDAIALAQNIVKNISFESGQYVYFDFFDGVMKTYDDKHVTCKILKCSYDIKQNVSKDHLDKGLDNLTIKNIILDKAKNHYFESLNCELDYESRGSHLYKSFEEIKKVKNSLNVSEYLIKETSKVLQKARHIEAEKIRIPGKFTKEEYIICKNVMKELIQRYMDFLNSEDICKYKILEKSDFFAK
jgi:predicted RNase H-related nuclease YkuK (DUF458 family)